LRETNLKEYGGGTTMAKFSESIFISAPVEKVFEYHSNPANNPEYWPSFQEVRDIEDLPSGGKKFSWTYKMAGISLEGTTETVEVIPNKRLVIRSKGGIESTLAYDYTPEGEGTRFSVTIDYKVPIPVLGKLAETIIVKMNEREGRAVLENLKVVLEG
jgi:uncharacterized membrane protein